MKIPTIPIFACLLGSLAFSASLAKADTLDETTAYYVNAGYPDSAYVSAAEQGPSDVQGTIIKVGSSDLTVTELGAFVENPSVASSTSNNYGETLTTTTAGLTYTTQGYYAYIEDLSTDKVVASVNIAPDSLVTVIPYSGSSSEGTNQNSPIEFAYAVIAPLKLDAGVSYALLTQGDPNEMGTVTSPYARTYPGNGYYTNYPSGYLNNDTFELQTGADLTVTAAAEFYNGSPVTVGESLVNPTNGGVDFAIGANIIYSVPEPSDIAYLVMGGAVLFFALRRKISA